MIEAPEAVNLSAQLDSAIGGKQITVVIAGFTPHKFAFFNSTSERWEELLMGRTVRGARAWGGMVEIETDGVAVIFSDGANIIYHVPGAALPAKHQLLIGFADESCITVSVRMYAILCCYETSHPEQLSEYCSVAKAKPQVLSDDFTPEYFASLTGAPGMAKKSAKAALATDQTIPGLGNGVLQDILYNAGIHPKTKVGSLAPEQLQKLYGAVVSTLREMAAAGGRNSETDIFGRSGGYIPWLSKDTEGESCTRCGQMIRKENYMGGSIYYCPGCQK